MTAPQFIAFLERKLTEHGAGKVVPDESVLAEHAARILEREAAARWLATMPRTTIPDAPDGLGRAGADDAGGRLRHWPGMTLWRCC